MKPNILSFGEIIWDIYDTKSHIGGAGLNFAAHCSMCGANSFLFSAVGADELGKNAINIIHRFNINQYLIKHSNKETGQCIVTLNADGTPDFKVLKNSAYDNITISDDDISFINKTGFDALYFGTLIQRSPISRESLRFLCKKCSFKEIVCDINLRKGCYDKESVKFCLENATILKFSDEEEPLMGALNLYYSNEDSPKSICEAICDRYKQIKYVILTLGEKGSFVYCTESKNHFTTKAKPVRVASTVGAGDSFIAGWITSYLCTNSAKTATDLATNISGYVVSMPDAIPDYTLDDGVVQPASCKGLLCDMHVHSQNSHDSTSVISDITNCCIQNNVSVFAVTDHCDIQYYVERDMPSCIKNSMEETEQTAKKFKGKVEILKGIEIGEGIWNKKYTGEILGKYNYDVIIGSVHAVRYKNYTEPYSVIDFSKMTQKEIDGYLKQYFDDVLTMLKEIPCDIMAHLTCPLRYINGKYNMNADITKYKDEICSILEYIIAHSIAMEINTSCVGTAYGCFMPDEWIVKKFSDLGGHLITLGSDAHIPENVGKDFLKAINLLKKHGFCGYYYYKNRKSIICEI